jgi:hypothetical protein
MAAPAPRRRPAGGDRRSAAAQLNQADQEARVAKAKRATDLHGALTAPLAGKDFRLAENVGIMPLMEWAASSDVDVASADGLRAVYYVLKDAVHEDEWAEFRKFARDEKLEATELLDFANAALEALAGRPTEEPSGSSDG